MLSFIILVPEDIAKHTPICDWRSVGNPGYGIVFKSTAFSLLGACNSISSFCVFILHPASSNLFNTGVIWLGLAPFTTILPPVIAAIQRNVPVSILSGMILKLISFSFFTPSISIMSVPAPFILAPILFKKSCKLIISGSLALFVMVVFPLG